MPVRIRQIFLHLLVCIAFLGLPFLFFPHPSEMHQLLNDPPTQNHIIGQLLLIAFFYLNYFWLIPKFYFTKRYLSFALMLLICLAVYLLLPFLITNGLYNGKPSADFGRHIPRLNDRAFPKNDSFINQPMRDLDKEGRKPPFGKLRDAFPPDYSINFFLFIAVFFFALNLAINEKWKRLEEEKTNAELAYLKAQINPHFLFNTLNSIYSLTVQKSDAAPKAVVTLSGMMRYVLHEADKEFVPVEKEVKYIEDYLALQVIRFGDAVKVYFNLTGDTTAKKIAPLLLLPIIENAFKHGVNAEENSEINITIDIVENTLYFSVRNNKVSIQGMKEDKSGIGLHNVQNRLQLLYGGNYELNIDDNTNYFSVTLKLQLT